MLFSVSIPPILSRPLFVESKVHIWPAKHNINQSMNNRQSFCLRFFLFASSYFGFKKKGNNNPHQKKVNTEKRVNLQLTQNEYDFESTSHKSSSERFQKSEHTFSMCFHTNTPEHEQEHDDDSTTDQRQIYIGSQPQAFLPSHQLRVLSIG